MAEGEGACDGAGYFADVARQDMEFAQRATRDDVSEDILDFDLASRRLVRHALALGNLTPPK